MSEPRILAISVVMPVYNAERALSSSLPPLVSLLLDHEILELIVVDDGSTDASAWVAEEAGARVLPSGGRLGPAGARNAGAAVAKGNVLWFVDADVVVHPDAARVLKDALVRTGAAAVFGSYDEFPAATNFLSQYRNLAHRHHHVRAERAAETFFAGCGAVRASAFRLVGGFDAARYPRASIEDVELGVRLRQRGYPIIIEPELQARHLRTWHFGDVVRSDILQNALPWARLVADGRVPAALHLSFPERMRTLVAWAFVLGALGWFATLVPFLVVLALFGAALAINANLFTLFGRANGWPFAFGAMAFHQLHYVYTSAAFIACRLGWAPDRPRPPKGAAPRRG
ncbi:MAG TPA: glycosyltransferase family 2 protein [Casimicrobiaceae bacterium]|jgi:cellulose synthase/poly-beta-1,6-N-acetylglucosamine synthase-like glycosyltransferase|nr:glycosyltransferase family 2 protein [Casimicrobiaceae bacterium]